MTEWLNKDTFSHWQKKTTTACSLNINHILLSVLKATLAKKISFRFDHAFPKFNCNVPEFIMLVDISSSNYLRLLTLSPASGGRLNKKDGLTRYGDSHVKDKTS